MSSLIKNIPVLIPVYNNEKTVVQVAMSASKYFETVLIVDDGSDIPVEHLIKEEKYISIIRHQKNIGKGQAIITGLNELLKMNFKQAISIDADGQHNIEDILPYLNDMIGKENCIFIGNRNMNTLNVPKISKFGKKNSNFWIFLETFKKVGDSQCGYRLYPTKIALNNYKTTGFDFETEVIVKHLWNGGKVEDFPISVKYFGEKHISHFDKKKDNIKISLLHLKLMLQRYLLLKGLVW